MAAPNLNEDFAGQGPVVDRRAALKGGLSAALFALAGGAAVNAVVGANDAEAQSPARRAMIESKGRIVLFYGQNIYATAEAASVLSKDGYPAIAMGGYSQDDKIMLIVDGRTRGSYTQDDLYGGVVLTVAARMFERDVAALQPAENNL